MLLGSPIEDIPFTGRRRVTRDQLPNYYSFPNDTHAMTTSSGHSQAESKEPAKGGSGNQKGKSSRSRTSEVSEQIQDGAGRLADNAKTRLANRAEEQKAHASDQLEDIGGALREASDTLQESDKDSMATLTDGAGRQIERLSHYLRETSVNEMLSEAKGFARRQPGMFLGGAAVLGLFGSRFFRSSDPNGRRYKQGRGHKRERRSDRAIQ